MLLPRLYALAERAWVQEPAWERSDDAEARLRHDADWSRFTNQLARRVLPRLDAGTPGVSYRIAPPGLLREGDTVRVNSELPGMVLRYTTDDSEPTAASPLVQGALGERAILRVAAFDHNGRSGRSSVVDNR
jgi:hexosaminidase